MSARRSISNFGDDNQRSLLEKSERPKLTKTRFESSDVNKQASKRACLFACLLAT
jgi:hypothetical protein